MGRAIASGAVLVWLAALTAASPCVPLSGCQRSPSPLEAPYKRPATLACACSCLQLWKQGGNPQDGVYWFTGMKVPVLCDFSHDGGGWTLLLTAVSKDGWDPLSVLARSKLSPNLTDNYSILKQADNIRDLGTGDSFAYRIETQAEIGRQRWGGIWFAPRHYSFVDETANQTDIALVRRFNVWLYKDDGVKRRMPWINTGGYHANNLILTTTGPNDANVWGTMVAHVSYTSHTHSPWQNPEASNPGTVLYWMREDAL